MNAHRHSLIFLAAIFLANMIGGCAEEAGRAICNPIGETGGIDMDVIEGIELLEDTNFQQGFQYLGTVITQKPVGILDFGKDREPVWTLAQWYSKYPLLGVKARLLESQGIGYESEGAKIAFRSSHYQEGELVLAAYGSKEWGNTVLQPGDSWPHLLIQQKIGNSPFLSELEAVFFEISAKVNHCELCNKALYDRSVHAVRFRANLIIQNRNRDSAGYGDYYWFVLTLYDNRYIIMPEIGLHDQGSDKKQASGKYIYGPDMKPLLGAQTMLNTGTWVTIQADLLPYIKEGLESAWKRGYLSESKRINDYCITSFNIGYELTGSFDIEAEIRGLKLIAVFK